MTSLSPSGQTDQLLASVLRMWRGGWDSLDIARFTGLPEATVIRVLHAWREERRRSSVQP